MELGRTSLQDLVRESCEAALDPTRWAHLLASARLVLGGQSGAIGITDGEGETAALSVVHEIDAAARVRWQTEFASQGPWAEVARGRAGSGSVTTGASSGGPTSCGAWKFIARLADPRESTTACRSASNGTVVTGAP